MLPPQVRQVIADIKYTSDCFYSAVNPERVGAITKVVGNLFWKVGHGQELESEADEG